MASLTVQRNSIKVGRNCESYNKKHPENPIDMRPIYNARRKAPVEWNKLEIRFVILPKILKALKKLVNLSRPVIAVRIFKILTS